MVQPGSAHAPSVSTKDCKRTTSATPERSLLLGAAFVRVIAIAASVALRTRLVPTNAAGALVTDPMITAMAKAARAVIREHVRLVSAAGVENRARTARAVRVAFPVVRFLVLVIIVLIVESIVAQVPPTCTKKYLRRFDRLLERRIEVNLVDDVA